MSQIDVSFDEVIEAAREGAEWAWVAIIKSLIVQVTGFLAGRGASDPEGMANEVFLHVARGIHGFAGNEKSFRSWVFTIAYRRLLDERRAAARRPNALPMPHTRLEQVGGNVEEEAIERLVTAEIERAFVRLTEDQRDVIYLRVIGGLTVEETAGVLEKSIGAVKAAQRRALTALRKMVEED
jgi:RNA polymerase sigma-70 factor (ECF subfamily)